MKINIRIIKRIIRIFLIVLLVGILTGLTYVVTYVDPYHEKLEEVGIEEKQIQVGDVMFNYAEGPDNGPALLLLHAQHMDWYSYSRVLPELSKHFHVYAVDYQGHGKTTYPSDYELTANNIGQDLARFIEEVIGEPAYVTGNSSGGLLTTWLAANAPEDVKAIVLEDPPLFSAEYPRVQNTIAYRSFTTAYEAQQTNEEDFLMYWLDSNATFFKNHVGAWSLPAIKTGVNLYRVFNRDQAIEIAYMPTTVRLMIRGFDYYDPAFGAGFYDGQWNEGFDHAQALESITCPVLLIHANFTILDSGELNGAMSQEEADRVMSLLQDGQYIRVDSDHVTHLDNPDQFIHIIEDFFQ